MKARFPELRERTLGTLVLLFLIIGTTGNSATGGGSIDLQSPDADQVIGPARQAGGGFEFRRRLSSIDNPYCAIVTYVLPDFPEQASSTQDADDRSVIVIDASTLKMERAYSRFLMAHECCHHTLGHTRLTSQRFGQLGPQPFSTSSRYSRTWSSMPTAARSEC